MSILDIVYISFSILWLSWLLMYVPINSFFRLIELEDKIDILTKEFRKSQVIEEVKPLFTHIDPLKTNKGEMPKYF
jgi:hypothetical protein